MRQHRTGGCSACSRRLPPACVTPGKRLCRRALVGLRPQHLSGQIRLRRSGPGEGFGRPRKAGSGLSDFRGARLSNKSHRFGMDFVALPARRSNVHPALASYRFRERTFRCDGWQIRPSPG
jgi:hypothetical protein